MSRNADVRWRQRLQSFRKAFDQLAKAAALAEERELSDLEQQGLIQAFEFTHELAWNTLEDFLESRGATGLYGSKDVTRETFAKGLIGNGDAWMDMMTFYERNLFQRNGNRMRERIPDSPRPASFCCRSTCVSTLAIE
jgi:nucleotidyltransferase substrate binding protein (TIGR01987 family)